MNKIFYACIYFTFILCSCNKIEGFTSSGVEIVIPNGNENYLNQTSDSLFIFFTNPCSTFPGPTSMNSVAPSSIIC